MPIVAPPDKVRAVEVDALRPVTVERVSDSELIPDVEFILMVEPEALIEVPPEPEIVKAPARSLRLTTTLVVSRPMVGLWPVETVMPVPPTAPYKTLGAVMFSANKVVPETWVSASIYNLWVSEVAARTWPIKSLEVVIFSATSLLLRIWEK